jgi:hypothetical protein
MINPRPAASSIDIEAISQLLDSYSFDSEDYLTEAIVAEWLEQYDPVWINHAVTEALYQGRYKLISVDQILKLWRRRGQPIRHFNREFESIVLGQTLLLPTGYGDSHYQDAVPSPLKPGWTAHSTLETALKAPESKSALSTSPSPAIDSALVDDLAEAEIEGAMTAPPTPPISSPPSSSTALAPFPSLPPDLAATWLPTDVIQPFVPRREASDLHDRLLAVAGCPI